MNLGLILVRILQP